jgi:putative membrane protein
MAFGFVVERFSLFLREISAALGTPVSDIPPSHGYAAIIGIILVVFGTLVGSLAFFRYKNIEKQIDNDASSFNQVRCFHGCFHSIDWDIAYSLSGI